MSLCIKKTSYSHYMHCYTSRMKGYTVSAPYSLASRGRKFCHATQIPAGWQPTCVYLGPTASANTNLHCNPHCQVQDFVPARKTLANTRLSESAICWNRRQPLKSLLWKTLPVTSPPKKI